MNLEGPPGTPRRVLMSQEFNAGYREQEERFTVCSPDAQASEKTLMAQGARISQALGARHRD
jgi:predicted secreted protein